MCDILCDIENEYAGERNAGLGVESYVGLWFRISQ